MNTYNLTEIELTELLLKQKEICSAEYYTNAAPDRYYDDLCDTILNAPLPPLPISGAKKEDIQPQDYNAIAESILKADPDFQAEGMSEYQNGRFNGIIEGLKHKREKEDIQPVPETDYLLSGKNGERLLGSIEQLKGEPVIDWEALDRDLCKNFFYSYTPKWVKWLKSNLPNYIK